MCFVPLNKISSLAVPWQTGNGAKFWPDGSANKACAAGVRTAKICHFRRPFLVRFLGEQKMNKKTI